MIRHLPVISLEHLCAHLALVIKRSDYQTEIGPGVRGRVCKPYRIRRREGSRACDDNSSGFRRTAHHLYGFQTLPFGHEHALAGGPQDKIACQIVPVVFLDIRLQPGYPKLAFLERSSQRRDNSCKRFLGHLIPPHRNSHFTAETQSTQREIFFCPPGDGGRQKGTESHYPMIVNRRQNML